jgi:hypothetical protein
LHFLAHLPRVARSLSGSLRTSAPVPGTGWRGLLVVAAVGGGAALALSVLPAINGWQP